MTDQKIRTARGKVPLDLIPLGALEGCARVFGYGAKKYSRGNFHTADDDQIAQRYVGGMLRHLAACQRPDGLYDMTSLAALDAESGLPEIDHAICGLIMLRALAIKQGALPDDPGEGRDPRPVEQILVESRVARGAFDVAPIRALPDSYSFDEGDTHPALDGISKGGDL